MSALALPALLGGDVTARGHGHPSPRLVHQGLRRTVTALMLGHGQVRERGQRPSCEGARCVHPGGAEEVP